MVALLLAAASAGDGSVGGALPPGVDPFGSAHPGDVGGGPSGAFSAFVLVVVVLVVAGAVFGIVSAVRNASVARRGGLDPMTARSQLAVALHQRLQPPAQGLEARLAELDALAARGVITEQERATARAQLLGSPPRLSRGPTTPCTPPRAGGRARPLHQTGASRPEPSAASSTTPSSTR